MSSLFARIGPRLKALSELGLALPVMLAGAAALTWPALFHLDEVIIGSGELGGWIWRYWWHFQEVDALAQSDLGLWDRMLTLLSLGRFPETGNILDVLLLSYPLQAFLDLPAHYNVKVLLILVLDGLCGYALARHFVDSRAAALAAGLVAVINPLNIQDLYGSGLRQVILWWILLFPILLNRAAKRGTARSGALAGICLALCGAFYWFYGLFAAMFLGIWLLDYLWTRRGNVPWRRLLVWLVPLLATTAVVAGVFALPYVLDIGSNERVGGSQMLPELSFFLPFPEYSVIRDVPLRPSTYEENVLSSLNRAIISSWSADYLFNPTYYRSLPLVVFLGGVLPALFVKTGRLRRARFWLLVFVVFYLGTCGPFLKWGAEKDSTEVVLFGESVVRLPYTWMFQWVPGMSRMFAPYRMGAMMVAAAVPLVAMGLGRIPRNRRFGAWPQRVICAIAMIASVAQVSYRFDVGPVAEGSYQPNLWRAAVSVSAMRIPDFYQGLDRDSASGLVELPLEQQQDLLTLYQVEHRWKVYRSWATPPAIPPAFREEGGGEAGARLRYLAEQHTVGGQAAGMMLRLSRTPQEVDPDEVDDVAMAWLMLAGNYRYLVVHERGYYLVDPMQGPALYQDVVRKLTRRLGLEPEEVVEHEWFDYPGNPYNVPDGPVYIPWSSHEVQLPDLERPRRYYMAIFDLQPFLDAYDGPPPPVAPKTSAKHVEVAPEEGRVHVEVPSPGSDVAHGEGPAHSEKSHQDVPPPVSMEHAEVAPPGSVDHVEVAPPAPVEHVQVNSPGGEVVHVEKPPGAE